MILTKKHILAAIDRGEIIAPRNQVQENSVNVSLGRELYTGRPIHGYITRLDEPRYWDSVNSTIMDDKEYYVLEPNKHYVGITGEEVGTVVFEGCNFYVPEMRARSTTGRHGITIACCAGVGDVGYHGRWALEIKNHNDFPVAILVGSMIGQVVFHTATDADAFYGGDGRYQLSNGEIRILPKELR